MTADESQNPRLLRQLARIIGIFGSRGWPELRVELPDGTTAICGVPKVTADKIQYVRKILKEYGQEPITE